MSSTYGGSAAWSSLITIPSDGDLSSASSVNVGFEALADRTVYLKGKQKLVDNQTVIPVSFTQPPTTVATFTHVVAASAYPSGDQYTIAHFSGLSFVNGDIIDLEVQSNVAVDAGHVAAVTIGYVHIDISTDNTNWTTVVASNALSSTTTAFSGGPGPERHCSVLRWYSAYSSSTTVTDLYVRIDGSVTSSGASENVAVADPVVIFKQWRLTP